MENILLFLLIVSIFVAAWQTERLTEARLVIKLQKQNLQSQREDTQYWMQAMFKHRSWGNYWEPFCVEIARHGLGLKKLTRLLNTHAKRQYKHQYTGPFTLAHPTLTTNSRGMFAWYLQLAANQREWLKPVPAPEPGKHRIATNRPACKKAHERYMGKAQSLNTHLLPG
jgi:hypothetical protein